MKGDENYPMSSFSRWIEHSCDGLKKLLRNRVPSQHIDKKFESRWKRRKGKKNIGV